MKKNRGYLSAEVIHLLLNFSGGVLGYFMYKFIDRITNQYEMQVKQ